MSVNFSARDFDHAHIVRSLNEIFERYETPKGDIIIEITEQNMATTTDHFKQQLCDLRRNGYHVWIDAFGSGYSSLNVFSQFDIDLIKFDLEFLRHLEDNGSANRHIMRSMVELCRELGVHTLAEGVETQEQQEFPREIGCEFAQGFYYYKPESLESIRFRVKNRSPVITCEAPEERGQLGKK